MPVLEEIGGRLQDIVVTPDGRLVSRIEGVILGVANIREGQIIQEQRSEFRVRVVVDGDFGEHERAMIRARCVERLGDVRLRFEVVDRIERTKGGKFRAVVSKLPVESRG